MKRALVLLPALALLVGACTTEKTIIVVATPGSVATRSPGNVSPPAGESPIVNVPTQGAAPTGAPATEIPPTPAPPPTPIVQQIVDDPPVDSSGCPDGCTESKPGCVIKGNINSEGVHIYHVPGGGSYTQTVITPSKGERWFCTGAEAEANGWRRAQN